MLRADGVDPTREETILSALQAPLLDESTFDQVELSLLRYAEKLTLAPAGVGGDDVEMVRAAGLDDRAIHDACAIVAYFAFVNRIADGLGVELEA
ncbi:MAG: peroxidase [Gemmatimonadetes bacterium]|nr:peroxidase [Gemmatimonadota bacterium]